MKRAIVRNEVGIQLLDTTMHNQLFPQSPYPSTIPNHLSTKPYTLATLAHNTLNSLNLLTSTPALPPLHFPLPPLHGPNLHTHFETMALSQSKHFQTAVDVSKAVLFERPIVWSEQSGWSHYTCDGSVPVDYPEGEWLVFDTEVLYKVSKYPVMAVAVSELGWYSWVSPSLFNSNSNTSTTTPSSTFSSTFSTSNTTKTTADNTTNDNTTNDNATNDNTTKTNGSIPCTLIKLGRQSKLVVGHFIAFDRARVFEEYEMEGEIAYLDTLSLHSAVGGLSSRQKPKWVAYQKAKKEKEEFIREEEEEESWEGKGALNSLAALSELYLNKTLDKTTRSHFDGLSLEALREHFQLLMSYCSQDVATTHELFQKVHPLFLLKCPSPVTFAGLLIMQKGFLTTEEEVFEGYRRHSEQKYQDVKRQVDLKLLELVEEAVLVRDWQSDPWLRQLDWTVPVLKYTKDVTLKGGVVRKGRLYKSVKMIGLPKWYRDLSDGKGGLKVSLGMNVVPLLMRLVYEGGVVEHSSKFGWIFPTSTSTGLEPVTFVSLQKEPTTGFEPVTSVPLGTPKEKKKEGIEPVTKGKEKGVIREEEEEEEERKGKVYGMNASIQYKRIPHPTTQNANVGSPLSKMFVKVFEQGKMTSNYKGAVELLKLNAMTTYWTSARARILDLFVHYNPNSIEKETSVTSLLSKETKENVPLGTPKEKEEKEEKEKKEKGFEPESMREEKSIGSRRGVIIPLTAVMGTVTRRATDSVWMTASNAKANRIGSELKSMITAPPNYTFIGADVDSQELWISSLIGDSLFGIHGATAAGYMTLQGTKKNGTDCHSVSAKIVGCPRDVAKVFNYSRIYGAGVAYAASLIEQHDPALTKEQAMAKAVALYEKTKGKKFYSKVFGPFWYGGSESFMFNQMELIANSKDTRTPILHCQIPDTLLERYVHEQFKTSRINWVIQSSAVDYLHLLLVAMNYLIQRMSLDARFMLSIHDEVRFLVHSKDAHRASLALQIANLWTRAYFSERVGINSLPLNIAFFSAIDIDKVIRKEVDMDCLTPSNQRLIPHGLSKSIYEIINDNFSNGVSDDVYGPVLPHVLHTLEKVLKSSTLLQSVKSDVLFGTTKKANLENDLNGLNTLDGLDKLDTLDGLDGLDGLDERLLYVKATLCKTQMEVRRVLDVGKAMVVKKGTVKRC